MRTRRYNKGPIKATLTTWDGYVTAYGSINFENINAYAQLAAAPSGIFFNGSITGKWIYKLMHKPK